MAIDIRRRLKKFLPHLLVIVSIGTTAALSAQQVQPAPQRLTTPDKVHVDVSPRTTALFHRHTCPWLNGSLRLESFTYEEALKRYFQPHCACIHGVDEKPPCASAPLLPAAVATPAPVKAAALPPAPAAPPVERAAPAKALQPTSQRCQAITKKGTQCLRNAQPGRAYCWQH